MGEYCFLFKVNFWNDLEEKDDTNYGVIYANTFKEAMDMVEDSYGDDLGSVQLECFDCGLLTFDKDIYSKIRGNL